MILLYSLIASCFSFLLPCFDSSPVFKQDKSGLLQQEQLEVGSGIADRIYFILIRHLTGRTEASLPRHQADRFVSLYRQPLADPASLR